MVRLDSLIIYGLLSYFQLALAQPILSPALNRTHYLLVINDQILVAGFSSLYKLDPNTLTIISETSGIAIGKPTLFSEYSNSGNGHSSLLLCKNEGTCEKFRLSDLTKTGYYPGVGPLSGNSNLSLVMTQSMHIRFTSSIANAVYMAHTPAASTVELAIGLAVRNPEDLSLYTAPSASFFNPESKPTSKSYKPDATAADLEYLHMYPYQNMKFLLKNWTPTDAGRIGAVCENDVSLLSYIEMNLQCGNEYTYIQAVFTTSVIGDDLKVLQPPDTRGSRDALDYYIFLVMARSRESADSRLCGFHAETLRATLDAKFIGCQLRGSNDTIIGPSEWVTTRDTCPSRNSNIDSSALSTCQLINNQGYDGGSYSPVFVRTPKEAVHLADLNSKVVALVILKGETNTIAVTNDGDHTIRKILIGKTVEESHVYDEISDGITGPLQRSLAINLGHIYTLDSQHAYRLNLYACESAKTCAECTATNDPYCGWCSLSMSCTTNATCRWGTNPNHWLQTQCMEPSVEEDYKYISVEKINNAQAPNLIKISADFLPERLGDSSIQCCFSVDSSPLCSSGAVSDIYYSSRNFKSVHCSIPRTVPVPPGQGETPATLDLRLAGNTFFRYNFTFYNCSAYSTCTTCASAPMIFACKWCLTNNICTADGDDLCDPGERLVTNAFELISSTLAGPLHCPRIEPVTVGGREITDFHFASGSNVEDGFQIKFKVLALQPPTPRINCLLNWDGLDQPEKFVATRDPETVSGEDDVYTCGINKPLQYSSDDQTKTVQLKVQIESDNGERTHILDNNESIKVTMYKCYEMAGDCGLCLATDQLYNCGWCQSLTTRCDVASLCTNRGDVTAVFIRRNSESSCPNNEINSFTPSSGPINGATTITIQGVNLGQDLSDIMNGVSIVEASDETSQSQLLLQSDCAINEKLTQLPKMIVCNTSSSSRAFDGHIHIRISNLDAEVVSRQYFKFLEPRVQSINPAKGPYSGGTRVLIQGENLHIGSSRFIKMYGSDTQILSEIPWPNMHAVAFLTPPLADSSPVTFQLIVDGFASAQKHFQYMEDASIDKIIPNKGIASGGTTVLVFGENLDVVAAPRMYLIDLTASRRKRAIDLSPEVRQKSSPCEIINSTLMECAGPATNTSRGWFDFGFIMDGIIQTLNLASKPGFSEFEQVPDPIFDKFNEPYIVSSDSTQNFLSIKGKDLLAIGGEELVMPLITVMLTYGGSSLYCNVSAVSDTVVTCDLPVTSLSENTDYTTMIKYGKNFEAEVGYVKKSSSGILTTETIAIIAGVISFLGLVVIIIIIVYCRKYRNTQESVKNLENQLDNLELRVAKECKEAFAELQTDMHELTSDIQGLHGLPWIDYNRYAMKFLFPMSSETDHPVMRNLEIVDRKSTVESGLAQFGKLINNRTFLLAFVRTLENQPTFGMKERVDVASLLSVALQGRMEYHTAILKTLLQDLIEKAMSTKSNPRILLRRAESIAEKMLSNWFTFLLHKFLKECAGDPLYLLFRAIKQQVDKGPVDAVTADARYSLSEDKLLRQSVDYQSMTLRLKSPDRHAAHQEPQLVKVLSCDTVSQAMEKILDLVYRNAPYSLHVKPLTDSYTLEWIKLDRPTLIMTDDDPNFSRLEGETRSLVRLSDYKIPDNSMVQLVEKQLYHSLENGNYPKSTSTKFDSLYHSHSNGHSSPAAGMSRTNSSNNILDNSNRERHTQFHHLVKTGETDTQKTDRERSKMVSEIYLTRLLATKGTLQSFVDDLFETIFSTTHRGSALPLGIKYMFDFLDDQALLHNITDPEVIHKWKSNSLPLRFWVNLIKNPDFVFDIHKSNIVDACLSVVAQIFMESCSTSEHRLGIDSPSTKLLYAKDIPKYRSWVNRYYQDIKSMPAISDKDMNQMLAEESRQQTGVFNTTAALYELYNYSLRYNAEIMEALEYDEFARNDSLKHKLSVVNQMLNFQ